MAIVCIKIGENELQTYPKFAGLSKHLDIIEVLPRKRDKQGKLLNRTIGAEGDKHYFGLNVNMSHLNDKEFNEMRAKLREVWEEDKGKKDIDGNVRLTKIVKRLRTLDLSPTKRIHLGLSDETIAKIDVRRDLKRAKQSFNMMEVNRYDKVIPFSDFVKGVRNKKTGQTLEEELNG